MQNLKVCKERPFIFYKSKRKGIFYLEYMNKLRLNFIWIAALFLFLSSCKSEFEKLRTSGNADAILKKADALYDKGDYSKAQTLYDLVISSLRGRQDAEKVYFRYAYTHYFLEKYVSGNYYFDQFSKTYPGSASREEADYMAAYCNYKQSPGHKLDQTATGKAIDELQLFVNTYQSSERVKEANKLIDEMRQKLEIKAFNEGTLYFNLREYQAAIQTYNNVLKDFPETNNAEFIRYKIILAAYDYAKNSVLDKQEERYKLAIEESDSFLGRFDKSKYRKEVASINKESKKKLKEIFADSKKAVN
jgi:outer membrane protein assembly factor BamD